MTSTTQAQRRHGPILDPVPTTELQGGIERAAEALLALQRDDGHWAFELEADATIPAEYILLQHYLGEIDVAEERRIAAHLREIQGKHGGWPLFHEGPVDLSATVKAYFALKAVGDAIDAPHMAKARAAILARGGAERANVFTRILLALFDAVPWQAVPVMPVEIMLLPEWFPFHLKKISYWSRTVIVPLLVLMALRPKAKNPRGIEIRELFRTPPLLVADWLSHADRSFWGVVFAQLDRVLRRAEPYFPKRARQKAIAAAVAFVDERLNGEDGLGAIYPAMSNALVMYHELGYAKDHPNVVIAKQAIRKLLVLEGDRAYCQPCLSPVWDTSLAAHALLEAGGAAAETSVQRGLDWLVERQVLDVRGDWSLERPDIRPGGWPFQYANPHYPDLDDTAVVVMALDRADRERYRPAIERATEWVVGMQSRNGGWGAFDADNTYYYLNHIPFADHGALLDPPTADVTGRCLGMLAQLGFDERHAGISGGLAFLRSEQEADGSWFGRWGTNYIYGTWSVLTSYNAAGVDPATPEVQRAVEFLVTHQRADGGWGEDGASYYDDQPAGEGKESTPSQTAWALLALMAAGEIRSPAVTRGIRYLVETQQGDGFWDEALYTAVGFPRVFYLRYHGYRAFFPLWALARYRNLLESNATRPIHGL